MSSASQNGILKSVFCVATCLLASSLFAGVESNDSNVDGESTPKSSDDAVSAAVFAGGGFWFMESAFEELSGVCDVVTGYAGGLADDRPTFSEVLRGDAGHVFAVRVTFDPTEVSYADLVETFWRNIDPTNADGQFADRGQPFMTAIFVASDAQRTAAEESKARLVASKRFRDPIVTAIRDATDFHPAEERYQDFHRRRSREYAAYVRRSGRDRYLSTVWGADRVNKPDSDRKTASGKSGKKKYSKPSDAELKKRLTRLQYKVTQSGATERAFNNEYWDNKRAGIYVDIASGEPLFSSKDKFESGTGWPSFTKPLVNDHVVEKIDRGLFVTRTEVRSKHGESHLGHVFGDGPAPTGLRYCLNSAALKFIPVSELEKQGYGDFLADFESTQP